MLKFPAWKVTLIVVTLIVGVILCLPNLVTEQDRKAYLGWLPSGAMKLGLDLRGGASILLEIDPEELAHNKAVELNRDVRQTLINDRPAIFASRTVEGDELHIKLQNPDDAAEAIRRIQKLGAPTIGQVGGKNSLIVSQRADGVITVKLTQAALTKLQTDALQNSIEAVRRRVDNTGTVEPNIQKQGDSRIIVEVPGLADPTGLIDLITQAGVLYFKMVDTQANPADYTIGESQNGRTAYMDTESGQPEVVFDDPIITGQDLKSASQSFDQNGRPNISFTLRPAGAQRFGKTTTNNIGKPFAIILDDHIVSAPTIQSPITGGSGQITGNFTIEQAENLAIVLRSGALPAKLKVVERRVVGPGLGQDSIRAGITASIVGLILVVLFMLAIYGLLGIFAVAALFFNVALLVGFLSGIGATMTLPGIAGIILTIGMAVDANVLIFERIREEKHNGRSVVSAIESGYSHAMTTIIDANATHFLAGLIMFNLGSGPIRGFALTLAVGIVSSLFTAVVVARLFMSLWLKWFRPRHIPIGFWQLFRSGKVGQTDTPARKRQQHQV
ncbi:MAG: protein translocase subunit SecD [Alphaproteobacteria bacterium]|nr:protein translocase subunit SecD [Alphaproteobacteria bacterium]